MAGSAGSAHLGDGVAGRYPQGGFLVVDKEAGWTSHDVVARCRRLLGERRVGHAGTLDPDATGVLLVGFGRATRLLRFTSARSKSYVGEVVLGRATTTLDSSGEVVGEWDMAAVTLDEVREKAVMLTGEIMQVPPMVSALKVGGRRLHELAREGVEVERRPRRVCVERFEVLGPLAGAPGVFLVEVECSAGTYVRSLAADLGALLGGGAHLRNLRRTAVGSFGVEEAHRIGELSLEHVLSPAEALRDMEMVRVGPEVDARVRHGLALDGASLGATGEGPCALVDADGALLAVYEPARDGRMRAAVVLAGA
ncbi:MAG: tRNA pseudouridine(55) synthase TruB [Actinomycetota bacterium]|nr:tRNA pseudouridine(55) synthase TruB [Actinomycetota bacterium]